MPGKFEGEPEWVRLLWDLVLSGASDESVYDGDIPYDGFHLTPQLAELTGYSADADRVIVLWENDDGFVNHTTMSVEEFHNIEGFTDFEIAPTGEWIPGVDPDWDSADA